MSLPNLDNSGMQCGGRFGNISATKVIEVYWMVKYSYIGILNEFEAVCRFSIPRGRTDCRDIRHTIDTITRYELNLILAWNIEELLNCLSHPSDCTRFQSYTLCKGWHLIAWQSNMHFRSAELQRTQIFVCRILLNRNITLAFPFISSFKC